MVSVVQPEKEREKGRPVFEGRLERGVTNRIEVEVLAGTEGEEGAKSGKVEWEKVTAFVFVMR